MKNNLFTFLLFVSVSIMFAQTTSVTKPQVDKRVEMLSIAFRLADAKEYNSKTYPEYVSAIEKHFSSFRNHELISFIKELREVQSIGYDAVMFMAIHISQPPQLEPLVSFNDTIPEKRWDIASSKKFLQVLQEFYRDSDFDTFFNNNKELYEKSKENFDPIFNMLDFKWYQSFYGEKPNGKFNTIIGLGNGVGNYGPKITYPTNRVDRYSIMGVSAVDSLGAPQFNPRATFPVLVHEINHSFVNHLSDVFKDKFEESGKKLFSKVQEPMEELAYGNWLTMINESIVRAAVLKYIHDHDFGEQEYKGLLMHEINAGFLWMEALANELKRYDNNRDTYPTLQSFMPQLVQFFTNTALNIDEIEETLNEKRPKVIGITEFKNNAQNVDYKLKQIKVTFDRPLAGRGYSYIKGEKGDDAIPDIQKVRYTEDKKTVIFTVALSPNKTYQFILMGAAFKTNDGYGMEHYEINFATKN